MTSGFLDKPQIGWLPDGKRLNMRHGPIDLILKVDALDERQTRRAYQQAVKVFPDILPSLCAELDLLRKPVSRKNPPPQTRIGRHMREACEPFADRSFLTPMIGVAGAVADYILSVLCETADLRRAYVNNGGDIALHLAEGETFNAGICTNPVAGDVSSSACVTSGDGIGGIATSGWRGRSHSMGIADAVTVLAADAAMADVAATLIANEIDLPGSKQVERVSARELNPDSDLGDRLVTVSVSPLSERERNRALDAGIDAAEEMMKRELIRTAFLALQGSVRTIGDSRSLMTDRAPVSVTGAQAKRELLHA